MDGNRNQQFNLEGKRKTSKQLVVTNGSKVLTAKEVKEFIDKNYDDNEDCLLLIHMVTFDEEKRERKISQRAVFTKEMEF